MRPRTIVCRSRIPKPFTTFPTKAVAATKSRDEWEDSRLVTDYNVAWAGSEGSPTILFLGLNILHCLEVKLIVVTRGR